MSEADVIAASGTPRTRASLGADLRALGVREGAIVIAHTALSQLGWVNGGPQAVIDALLDAIGPTGTMVMPAQSGHLTDPAHWQEPPVPADWMETIRQTMPVFDPARTPTRGLGQVAELFRTWPGAVRSAHPHTSFAALGPKAAEICDGHALDSALGEQSPLARLYDLDAEVLLLGVGFDRCTALHLAEIRAYPDAPLEQQGARILIDGEPRWVTFPDPVIQGDGFPPFGEDDMIASGAIVTGPVGSAPSLRMPVRTIVNAAVAAWRKPRA